MRLGGHGDGHDERLLPRGQLSKGDLAEPERIPPPGAAVGDRTSTSPTGTELAAP